MKGDTDAQLTKSILIVEDEAAIRELIAGPLRQAGFDTAEAADIAQASTALAARRPDLVLLDWMLPGVSGIEFARRLRRDEATRDVPIIMLTARGEESDRLRGFDAGIDDYISKPFSVRELVARVQAVLRRAAPQGEDQALRAGALELDPISHRVRAAGEPLRLGPTEFRLLRFFMSHPERVFTRGQLLDGVWGEHVYVEERTVDVHVRRLRKALAPHGHDRLVQTVHGTGYRFARRLP